MINLQTDECHLVFGFPRKPKVNDETIINTIIEAVEKFGVIVTRDIPAFVLGHPQV